MPFSLSAEHERLIEQTRRMASSELVPIAESGEPGRINRPLLKALGAAELLPRLWPRESALSALELCCLREALACESTAAETAFALQGLGGHPMARFGSSELAERWLPAVVRGEAVPAFALTEPGAGTDAAALSLEAKPERGGYRLTGEKKWISNAPEADVYAVFARTTPEAGARGITAFAVAGDSEGLSGNRVAMISEHPLGSLVFDGVFVPEDCVLGEVDGGFRVAMETLDLFRPSVGAAAVGMAQAALEAAIGHAGSRTSFGRPLKEFQAISQKLAEMATRTDAARLLVYRAASSFDAGEGRVTKASAMAKLFATETAQFVVDAAVQVHGAAALESGHLLEHLYRDVRSLRIYEGTSEIQREIITRELYR